jgi:hypothetical protein
MESRLDYLFQEWHQLGGEVLVSEKEQTLPKRELEEIIAESTNYCRDSSRLMWVILDWIIHHIDQIDEKKLLKETQKKGDLSVLGVLSDLAYHKNTDSRFKYFMAHCSPKQNREIFFKRVAQSPLAAKLTKENPLEIFLKWNYLSNEVRYLH